MSPPDKSANLGEFRLRQAHVSVTTCSGPTVII